MKSHIMKKKYIKPECELCKISSGNIMLDTSPYTGTGSDGYLSNKWRDNSVKESNDWSNIWSK